MDQGVVVAFPQGGIWDICSLNHHHPSGMPVVVTSERRSVEEAAHLSPLLSHPSPTIGIGNLT